MDNEMDLVNVKEIQDFRNINPLQYLTSDFTFLTCAFKEGKLSLFTIT